MVSVKPSPPKNVKHKKQQKPSKVQKNKKKTVKIVNVKDTKNKKGLAKQVILKPAAEIIKGKKTKYTMPSKNIKEETVEQCLVILEHLKTTNKKKNAIFDEEVPIFAELNCIKIQSARGNIKIVLPHSTCFSTNEVCLITPDIKKGKKHDHEQTVDRWEEILRNANVTSVKTILPMRQLKVEYDQYELKRRLLTQHDFIMVDTKVLNHVSHMLGKMFFKKHNMIIPVRLDEKGDVKKDIDIGLKTAMLRLNVGPTSTVVVGHTGMQRQQLKENVMALVQQLKQKYPGGEANIRSLALKLPLSLSLPLYVTLRPSSTVNQPKLIHKKPKHFTEVEGDLSTALNTTVKVAPDGTVHTKRPLNTKSSKSEITDEPELEDIEEELDDIEEELEAESD